MRFLKAPFNCLLLRVPTYVSRQECLCVAFTRNKSRLGAGRSATSRRRLAPVWRDTWLAELVSRRLVFLQ